MNLTNLFYRYNNKKFRNVLKQEQTASFGIEETNWLNSGATVAVWFRILYKMSKMTTFLKIYF